mgnify:CR=1 FL=1
MVLGFVWLWCSNFSSLPLLQTLHIILTRMVLRSMIERRDWVRLGATFYFHSNKTLQIDIGCWSWLVNDKIDGIAWNYWTDQGINQMKMFYNNDRGRDVNETCDSSLGEERTLSWLMSILSILFVAKILIWACNQNNYLFDWRWLVHKSQYSREERKIKCWRDFENECVRSCRQLPWRASLWNIGS